MRFETSGNGATIVAEYKSYRRFSADSTLKFDSDSDEPDAAGAETQPQVIAAPPQVNIIPQEQPPQEPPKAAAVAAPAPDPVFRAVTRLVQVSVIAKDKDGKPVTDLRRDEFQIFDNAAPREIRLFLLDARSCS
jgi:hypothetical protein